jgi:hypothetical protein
MPVLQTTAYQRDTAVEMCLQSQRRILALADSEGTNSRPGMPGAFWEFKYLYCRSNIEGQRRLLWVISVVNITCIGRPFLP